MLARPVGTALTVDLQLAQGDARGPAGAAVRAPAAGASRQLLPHPSFVRTDTLAPVLDWRIPAAMMGRKRRSANVAKSLSNSR
jgi:hypothetical protein